MTVLLALGLSAGMSKELVKQKYQSKEQKRRFLPMLSGTLGTTILGNALTLFRMGDREVGWVGGGGSFSPVTFT